jgi:uncharacterized protein YjiS (DUF1127 family)
MILSHIIHALRAWRLYRACVHELSRLSDHELADIGISRAGIAWVAWHSAQEYLEHAKAASRRRAGDCAGLSPKSEATRLNSPSARACG